MKRKMKKKFLAVLLLAATLIGLLPSEQTYAGMYDNAKEFYENTGSDRKPYHADVVNGTIYYATSARLASSSSNEKYYTLGFDITLSGNGHAVSFAVQRTGGSMVQIGDPIPSGGYEYNLYAIQDSTLFNLATLANPTEAAYVLSAPTIVVYMNAIMTTKLGNSLRGGIAENGAGGVSEWGSVYHLGNYSHKMTMIRKFPGHDFKSYCDIREELKNPSLLINYNVQGYVGGSVSVGGGYGVAGNGILTAGGSTVMQQSTLLQPVYLLNPASIGLSKPGYYLEEGKEWTALNRTFTPHQMYMPMWIYPHVANGSTGITMYANWQANKYYIAYDGNGGDGYVEPATCKYGSNVKLRNADFSRRGYALKEGAEWNTKPDGTGVSYSSGQIVKNLSTKNGELVTLYAQWEPCIYKITTNPLKGTGGTPLFFVKFDHGWYTDVKATIPIANNTIETPTRVGYTFRDFLPYQFNTGSVLVNGAGKIVIGTDYFDKDSTIYAMYTPNIYEITFNKMGGTGGTDSVAATFDAYLPKAQAPKKTGYSFMGYYDNSMYTGELYYLKTMAANRRYTVPNDITLYAKWVDDISPGTTIKVDTDKWTNRKDGIAVEAKAWDSGSGLDKVELYCGDNVTPVAVVNNLKGTNETVTLNWVHLLEGVYRYKVVAYDMDGNSKEAYSYVRYDVKSPSGMITGTSGGLGNFSVHVDANDYNVQMLNITIIEEDTVVPETQEEYSTELLEESTVDTEVEEVTELQGENTQEFYEEVIVETTEETTGEAIEETTEEITEISLSDCETE